MRADGTLRACGGIDTARTGRAARAAVSIRPRTSRSTSAW
jgi:hypothetical protein